MNLSRREYRQLRWKLLTGRAGNIPKKRDVAKQRDAEGILFEGDIKFNTPLMDKVRYLRWRRKNARRPRAASRWHNGRWSNATVPYLINKSVGELCLFVYKYFHTCFGFIRVIIKFSRSIYTISNPMNDRTPLTP